MISIAYVDAAHSQVLVTDSEGVTRRVSSDWPGEFRMSNGVADVLAALGKAQPDPYVAPVKSAEQLRVEALKANARRTALLNAIINEDDVQLIADINARYPGLPANAIKAIVDIFLVISPGIRG